MRRGFKAEAERNSVGLRESIELQVNERICCFQLLEYLGIEYFSVEQFHDRFGLDTTSINTITNGNGRAEFSAILIRKNEGDFVIYNHAHSKQRVRSSITHEASHMICEHRFMSGKYDSQILFRDHPKEVEDEANWLAGCILIPKKGMEWAVKKDMKLPDIASHFDVSEELARWRYNMLGMAKRSQYMRRKRSVPRR